jgi:putative FmdB family regulatory protein
MPSYDYQCRSKHTTPAFRKIDLRHDSPPCHECGEATELVISKTHSPPSGVYSYMPNVGSEWDFERKRTAIKEGRKVQEVTRDKP